MSERFKPLTAQRVAEERFKGTTQHVAMLLARRTPPSGQIEITLAELAVILGYNPRTISGALREIVQAGLLVARRRGSVANVYRWTQEALSRPRRGFLADQTEGAETSLLVLHSTTIRRVVLADYVARRERKYGIPAKGGYRRLPDAWWDAVELRFGLLASVEPGDGDPETKLTRVVQRGLAAWFRRKGRGKSTFLLDSAHPLERLGDPEDLDWMTQQIQQHVQRPESASNERAASEPTLEEQLRVARANRDREEIARVERLLEQREAA